MSEEVIFDGIVDEHIVRAAGMRQQRRDAYVMTHVTKAE